MNARSYLESYGWKDGEALKKGGLKKPILVKHKKDTKGLGHDANDSDMWWEKLFDGQLQNLDVTNGSKNGSGVTFKTNEEAVIHSFNKALSPLYKMFVKGEGLKGTVGELKAKLENDKKDKKKKKSRIEKKESKRSKKKIKKDKKEKKEKKEEKKIKLKDKKKKN